MLTHARLSTAIYRRFPDAPICRPADSPEKRAAAAMKAAKVTPAMSTRVENGEIIDVLLKESAMAVFATTQVVFALYVHEVIRAVPDVGRVVVPLAGRYSCTASGCPLVLESAKKPANTKKVVIADDEWDEATIREHCPNGGFFTTMDDRYMHLLPEEIVSRLPFRYFRQNGTSETLLDQVRATEGDLQIRAVPDVGRVVVPLAGRYSCTASGCPLVLESAKKAANKKKVVIADDGWDEATIREHCPNGGSFTTMDDRYMQLPPEEIVSPLPFRYFRQNGTSETLLDQVRATEGDLQVQP
ncbi:unnamed protein product [Ectocarpus sp. CCAP 1310/34]|nr:unnamed protein product [Ectocarpus sp. CCAP 1310/34]